jgi:hypothetical protein
MATFFSLGTKLMDEKIINAQPIVFFFKIYKNDALKIA